MRDVFVKDNFLLQLNKRNSVWIDNFVKKNRRPFRILHIGNIANNAYLNSKFLRAVGIESDVLCHDYYHIMGCPEWEELDETPEINDYNRPNWSETKDLNFIRPRWFVQGPLDQCLDYLIAKNSGNQKVSDEIWDSLSVVNATASATVAQKFVINNGFYNKITKKIFTKKNAFDVIFDKLLVQRLVSLLTKNVFISSPLREVFSRLFLVLIILVSIPLRVAGATFEKVNGGFRNNLIIRHKLADEYSKIFPERNGLPLADTIMYEQVVAKFDRAFEYYDLIQGYATDGIFPLLAGRKYVAFEHGTIRNIPFEDTAQGRLCALTYCLANGVIITNADNLVAANKLGLKNIKFVPHPINDINLESATCLANKLNKKLKLELNADFLVFHPARQHWDSSRHPDWEKANDYLIHGLSILIKERRVKVGAVFVEWGASVEASKKLILELGIESAVKWIKPLSHRSMIEYIQACDVLADQFYLGAFGSTMPKGLMCGKPVLINLNYDLHEWCFPIQPPVINVKSANEISDKLFNLYSDRDYRNKISADGVEWYNKFHSSTSIVNSAIDLYKTITYG